MAPVAAVRPRWSAVSAHDAHSAGRPGRGPRNLRRSTAMSAATSSGRRDLIATGRYGTGRVADAAGCDHARDQNRAGCGRHQSPAGRSQMRDARSRATGALPDDDGACRMGQLEQGPQRGVRDQPPLHGEAGPSGDETAELSVQVTRRLLSSSATPSTRRGVGNRNGSACGCSPCPPKPPATPAGWYCTGRREPAGREPGGRLPAMAGHRPARPAWGTAVSAAGR
jgi:hypothetical protein